jgi:hypothetical protein
VEVVRSENVDCSQDGKKGSTEQFVGKSSPMTCN